MSDMFGSSRYTTRGVAEALDIRLQLFLWSLIEDRKQSGGVIDYLQIFELSAEYVFGEVLQKVIHRQEQPAYTESHYYRCQWHPATCTIWVMDSGSYSTMMFPEDY